MESDASSAVEPMSQWQSLWSSSRLVAGWSYEQAVARCVAMALAGINREFPCQLPMVWSQPSTVSRPRDLTPVFYGCYDWHSAVHSHWLLVRALNCCPVADWRLAAEHQLQTQFCANTLAAEAEFLRAADRQGFERPYGLAWLLQLDRELLLCRLPMSENWRSWLRPLVEIAADRLFSWVSRLPTAIRSGEHAQSAFAMGLMFDWAQQTRQSAYLAIVQTAARRLYRDEQLDHGGREPSGHDFLSPTLGAADFMRRVLTPTEFVDWLTRGLRGNAVPGDRWLPVTVADPHDGKLAHFGGLNFSRAWMAIGIAEGFPPDDSRRADWRELASVHLCQGLPILSSEAYALTHWVGSFAMYALTDSGRFPSVPSSR